MPRPGITNIELLTVSDEEKRVLGAYHLLTVSDEENWVFGAYHLS